MSMGLEDYREQVRRVIRDAMAKQAFPGAAVYIERSGIPVMLESYGFAQVAPVVRDMRIDSLFDVASLTKVVATLPSVLASIEAGKFRLDDKISDVIPEWNHRDSQVTLDGEWRSRVTVRHLLTHTSGLPGWRPLYLRLRGRNEYLHQICREPLEYEPGTKVVYSDLGFMLLGFLLEVVWNKPQPDICRTLIFDPLGMHETGYASHLDTSYAVSTERGNALERGMCEDYLAGLTASDVPAGKFVIEQQDILSHPWRTEVATGTVNDGNAFYGLGGISGHAGLYSTVTDLSTYFSHWRELALAISAGDGKTQHDTAVWGVTGTPSGKRGLPFGAELARLAIEDQTANLNIARTCGFEAAPTPGTLAYQHGCSAGLGASPGAFGHTGFTGTAMWYDRSTDTSAILLTNRVHPTVTDGIGQARIRFYEAAFATV